MLRALLFKLQGTLTFKQKYLHIGYIRASGIAGQSAEQTTMARLVLPYISVIVFLLLMFTATQPGTGTTHSDEGQDILCSAFYLYIYIYIYFCIFLLHIQDQICSFKLDIYTCIQLCSTKIVNIRRSRRKQYSRYPIYCSD